MRDLLNNFFDFLKTDKRFARAPEYAVGAGMAVWGFLLMFPDQSFTPNGSFKYVVQSPLGEFGWGVAIALLGGMQVVGTWKRETWVHARMLRVVSSCLTALLWTGVGVSLLVANPLGAWPIFLLIIAGLEWLVLLRHTSRGGTR